MSKLLASIFGFVCFAWVSVFSWFLSSKLPAAQSDTSLISASLSINDPAFSFAATDIFSFHQSDATPVVPNDNLAMLQALAVHLGENPGRDLELTGLYSPTERNQTPYPNLGIARAKAIENLLVSLGAPEEQLVASAEAVQNLYLLNGRILGGVNFVFVTAEATENEQNTTDSTTSAVLAQNEAVTDESAPNGFPAFAKTTADGVRHFFYGEENYDLDEANRPFLDSLRRVLRQEPSKSVILSGFSQSREEQDVPGNLAELRAKAVRRYLVDNGLRRKQIVVVSHPGSAKEADERRVEIKVEMD